jgi:hypothetical protein
MGVEHVFVEYDPAKANHFDLGVRKLVHAVELSHFEFAGMSGLGGGSGSVGPAGPAGPAGPVGPAGATGAAGAAGAQGPVGPAGPTGPAGATGATGLTGSKGDQGPAGLTGAAGAQGPQGPAGIQGIQGIQGVHGLQGEQGHPGHPGLQGEQGPRGPSGDPAATVWADLKATRLIYPGATAKIIPNWYPHTAQAELVITNPSFPEATGGILQAQDRNTVIDLPAFNVNVGEQFARITLRVIIDPVAGLTDPNLWLEDTITVGHIPP